MDGLWFSLSSKVKKRIESKRPHPFINTYRNKCLGGMKNRSSLPEQMPRGHEKPFILAGTNASGA